MRLILYLFAVAVLMVGSALTTHAVVQDDGLILYFSFDDATNGTVMDETGGGNDGAIDGAEIATDQVVYGKGSLLCDDGNDGVSVDSFPALEEYTDNSYLFWLNFTDVNSGAWNQIIAKKHPVLIVLRGYGPVTAPVCISTTASIPATKALSVQDPMVKMTNSQSATGITSQASKRGTS